MPHNAFALQKNWQALEIAGPESSDFLNRVTSADFKRIQPGEFTPGALLTPAGKLIVYFKALLLEKNRTLLLIPRHATDDDAPPPAQFAHDALERLHFRESLAITPMPGLWSYIRVLASDAEVVEKLKALTPAIGHLTPVQTGVIAFNEGKWTRPPVRLDLGLAVRAEQLAPAIDRLKQAGLTEVASLEEYRLRAADPAAPTELNAGTLPLEARLDDAVHENKGCYPGQEVIERIRAMGQPPRLLAVLRGAGAPPLLGVGPVTTPAIVADGQPAGIVTSACIDPIDGGWIGLGYVKRVCAKPDSVYTVDTQPISLQLK